MERTPDISGVFEAFKNTLWFKTTTWGRIYVHSWVFNTFNSITSSFCTLTAFMCASRQFFGEPILCDPGGVGDIDIARSSRMIVDLRSQISESRCLENLAPAAGGNPVPATGEDCGGTLSGELQSLPFK